MTIRGAARTLTAALLALLSFTLFTPAAHADNGAAMNIRIWGAHYQVTPTAGQCLWDVTFSLSLFNITFLTGPDHDLHISGATPAATADTLNLDANTQITVLNNAGLVPGVVVPADHGQPHSFTGYHIQFTVPCGTQDGNAGVAVVDEIGSTTATAPYVAGGVAQPVVTPQSALALAAGGALGLGLVARRGRRNRRRTIQA
jgi:hypothetical protein